MSNDCLLFIGAHPDDIELGAGGTAAKLVQQGYDVWWLILTAEADFELSRRRQNESATAASRLGLQANHVLSLTETDGRLAANKEVVAAVRRIVANAGIHPRLVFTHSKADSHNDHTAAASIALAAFRQRIVLHYGVVNSLVVSDFHPRLFVDTTQFCSAKQRALEAHDSQVTQGRILCQELQAIEARYATQIGAATAAEAFELSIQEGAANDLLMLQTINDCPFHAFWHAIIAERKLINIHGVPVYRRKRSYNWPADKDREGMARLRQAFTERWTGPLPVDEYSCGTEGVDRFLYCGDVLLSGGSVSNTITRSYFNYIPGIRYVIDYDMPEYRNIRIWDREAKKEIKATYETAVCGDFTPRVDWCIFTVMKNPMCENRSIVGCMGIHGFGGYGGYRLMSEPRRLKEFLAKCPIPFPVDVDGYQVLAQIDVRLDEACWDWKTRHVIQLGE